MAGVPSTRRRQRLSAEQRRAQLIDAAIDVLAEHGYGATTADAIAQRADVSKGLLWHYFADLDELMESTARQTVMTLASAVGTTIDLAAPAPQVIRSAIHGAADLRRTHGVHRAAMREIVTNLRRPDGRLRLSLDDYDELYTAQESIFRRGQEQGDFRDTFDPRILAVTYQGAVDAMLGYLDANPAADAGQLADTVADVLLGGICTDHANGRQKSRA